MSDGWHPNGDVGSGAGRNFLAVTRASALPKDRGCLGGITANEYSGAEPAIALWEQCPLPISPAPCAGPDRPSAHMN